MAKIMTVRPPEALHKWLKQIAAERGHTMNAVVLQILGEYKQKKEGEIRS